VARVAATKKWRILGAAVAVGALGIAPVVFASPASAGQPKSVTVTFVTASIGTGQTKTLTVTLLNGSSNSIGAAQLTVPTGFVITSIPPAPPVLIVSGAAKGAAVTNTQTTATFTNLGLKTGTTLTFQITVTAPSIDSCSQSNTGAYPWSAQVGTPTPNTQTPVRFSNSVTVMDSCHLAFLQGPTNADINTAISPDVTVQVLDATGAVVNSSDQITLAITPNSGTAGAILSGGGATQVVNTIADFNDVEINTAGTGYMLTATDSALNISSPPSSSFDVTSPVVASNTTSMCNGTCPTSTTDSNTGQTSTVSGTNGNNASLEIDVTQTQIDLCGDGLNHAPDLTHWVTSGFPAGGLKMVQVTFPANGQLDPASYKICYQDADTVLTPTDLPPCTMQGDSNDHGVTLPDWDHDVDDIPTAMSAIPCGVVQVQGGNVLETVFTTADDPSCR
jgi:hypothetical protein